MSEVTPEERETARLRMLAGDYRRPDGTWGGEACRRDMMHAAGLLTTAERNAARQAKVDQRRRAKAEAAARGRATMAARRAADQSQPS